MPRYQSHKQVYALQIKEALRAPGSDQVSIQFLDQGYPDISVDYAVVSRYWPTQGDYFVLYDDGYQSISPRVAFEEGYTKL